MIWALARSMCASNVDPKPDLIDFATFCQMDVVASRSPPVIYIVAAWRSWHQEEEALDFEGKGDCRRKKLRGGREGRKRQQQQKKKKKIMMVVMIRINKLIYYSTYYFLQYRFSIVQIQPKTPVQDRESGECYCLQELLRCHHVRQNLFSLHALPWLPHPPHPSRNFYSSTESSWGRCGLSILIKYREWAEITGTTFAFLYLSLG